MRAATPAFASQRERDRHAVLDHGRREGVEFLASFDEASGRVFPIRRGSVEGNRVQMSDDMARLARESDGRLVLTHNHPESLSFSKQDILTAANNPGLLLLYAEGHDGTSYTLNAPDPVSSDAYEAVAIEVRALIRRAIRSGEMSTEAASAHYNHIVTAAFDRQGLLSYTALMEGRRLSSYIAYRDAIDDILTTVVQRLAP